MDVKEAWEDYRSKALPAETSEVHLQIAQDAFYAAFDAADWKPEIMPPLPDDPQWLSKLQGDVPAGSPFYDAPLPPAVADDPLEPRGEGAIDA